MSSTTIFQQQNENLQQQQQQILLSTIGSTESYSSSTTLISNNYASSSSSTTTTTNNKEDDPSNQVNNEHQIHKKKKKQHKDKRKDEKRNSKKDKSAHGIDLMSITPGPVQYSYSGHSYPIHHVVQKTEKLIIETRKLSVVESVQCTSLPHHYHHSTNDYIPSTDDGGGGDSLNTINRLNTTTLTNKTSETSSSSTQINLHCHHNDIYNLTRPISIAGQQQSSQHSQIIKSLKKKKSSSSKKKEKKSKHSSSHHHRHSHHNSSSKKSKHHKNCDNSSCFEDSSNSSSSSSSSSSSCSNDSDVPDKLNNNNVNPEVYLDHQKKNGKSSSRSSSCSSSKSSSTSSSVSSSSSSGSRSSNDSKSSCSACSSSSSSTSNSESSNSHSTSRSSNKNGGDLLTKISFIEKNNNNIDDNNIELIRQSTLDCKQNSQNSKTTTSAMTTTKTLQSNSQQQQQSIFSVDTILQQQQQQEQISTAAAAGTTTFNSLQCSNSSSTETNYKIVTNSTSSTTVSKTNTNTTNDSNTSNSSATVNFNSVESQITTTKTTTENRTNNNNNDNNSSNSMPNVVKKRDPAEERQRLRSYRIPHHLSSQNRSLITKPLSSLSSSLASVSCSTTTLTTSTVSSSVATTTTKTCTTNTLNINTSQTKQSNQTILSSTNNNDSIMMSNNNNSVGTIVSTNKKEPKSLNKLNNNVQAQHHNLNALNNIITSNNLNSAKKLPTINSTKLTHVNSQVSPATNTNQNNHFLNPSFFVPNASAFSGFSPTFPFQSTFMPTIFNNQLLNNIQLPNTTKSSNHLAPNRQFFSTPAVAGSSQSQSQLTIFTSPPLAASNSTLANNAAAISPFSFPGAMSHSALLSPQFSPSATSSNTPLLMPKPLNFPSNLSFPSNDAHSLMMFGLTKSSSSSSSSLSISSASSNATTTTSQAFILPRIVNTNSASSTMTDVNTTSISKNCNTKSKDRNHTSKKPQLSPVIDTRSNFGPSTIILPSTASPNASQPTVNAQHSPLSTIISPQQTLLLLPTPISSSSFPKTTGTSISSSSSLSPSLMTVTSNINKPLTNIKPATMITGGVPGIVPKTSGTSINQSNASQTIKPAPIANNNTNVILAPTNTTIPHLPYTLFSQPQSTLMQPISIQAPPPPPPSSVFGTPLLLSVISPTNRTQQQQQHQHPSISPVMISHNSDSILKVSTTTTSTTTTNTNLYKTKTNELKNIQPKCDLLKPQQQQQKTIIPPSISMPSSSNKIKQQPNLSNLNVITNISPKKVSSPATSSASSSSSMAVLTSKCNILPVTTISSVQSQTTASNSSTTTATTVTPSSSASSSYSSSKNKTNNEMKNIEMIKSPQSDEFESLVRSVKDTIDSFNAASSGLSDVDDDRLDSTFSSKKSLINEISNKKDLSMPNSTTTIITPIVMPDNTASLPSSSSSSIPNSTIDFKQSTSSNSNQPTDNKTTELDLEINAKKEKKINKKEAINATNSSELLVDTVIADNVKKQSVSKKKKHRKDKKKSSTNNGDMEKRSKSKSKKRCFNGNHNGNKKNSGISGFSNNNQFINDPLFLNNIDKIIESLKRLHISLNGPNYDPNALPPMFRLRLYSKTPGKIIKSSKVFGSHPRKSSIMASRISSDCLLPLKKRQHRHEDNSTNTSTASSSSSSSSSTTDSNIANLENSRKSDASMITLDHQGSSKSLKIIRKKSIKSNNHVIVNSTRNLLLPSSSSDSIRGNIKSITIDANKFESTNIPQNNKIEQKNHHQNLVAPSNGLNSSSNTNNKMMIRAKEPSASFPVNYNAVHQPIAGVVSGKRANHQEQKKTHASAMLDGKPTATVNDNASTNDSGNSQRQLQQQLNSTTTSRSATTATTTTNNSHSIDGASKTTNKRSSTTDAIQISKSFVPGSSQQKQITNSTNNSKKKYKEKNNNKRKNKKFSTAILNDNNNNKTCDKRSCAELNGIVPPNIVASNNNNNNKVPNGQQILIDEDLDADDELGNSDEDDDDDDNECLIDIERNKYNCSTEISSNNKNKETCSVDSAYSFEQMANSRKSRILSSKEKFKQNGTKKSKTKIDSKTLIMEVQPNSKLSINNNKVDCEHEIKLKKKKRRRVINKTGFDKPRKRKIKPTTTNKSNNNNNNNKQKNVKVNMEEESQNSNINHKSDKSKIEIINKKKSKTSKIDSSENESESSCREQNSSSDNDHLKKSKVKKSKTKESKSNKRPLSSCSDSDRADQLSSTQAESTSQDEEDNNNDGGEYPIYMVTAPSNKNEIKGLYKKVYQIKSNPFNRPIPSKKYYLAGLYSEDFSKLHSDEKDDNNTAENSSLFNQVESSIPNQTTKSGLFSRPRLIHELNQNFQVNFDSFYQYKYNPFPSSMSSSNYRRVRQNVFVDVKPVAKHSHQSCNCVRPKNNEPGCGSQCINRMMYQECWPQNCPTDDKCSNQRIQKHIWSPGLQRFMTEERGWGIRTTEKIQKGEFIMEYIGEIVSDKLFLKRMNERYKNDRHHYSLRIEPGMLIDGYRVGNEGRFVNHSCEPNCEMQKWAVNGYYRMCMFAMRDIEPMEELFYDYNFDNYNLDSQQTCRCGSKNCRTVIGGRKTNLKNDLNYEPPPVRTNIKYQHIGYYSTLPPQDPLSRSFILFNRKNRTIKISKNVLKNSSASSLSSSSNRKISYDPSLLKLIMKMIQEPLRMTIKQKIKNGLLFLLRNFEKSRRLYLALQNHLCANNNNNNNNENDQKNLYKNRYNNYYNNEINGNGSDSESSNSRLLSNYSIKTRGLTRVDNDPNWKLAQIYSNIFKQIKSFILDKVFSNGFIKNGSKEYFKDLGTIKPKRKRPNGFENDGLLSFTSIIEQIRMGEMNDMEFLKKSIISYIKEQLQELRDLNINSDDKFKKLKISNSTDEPKMNGIIEDSKQSSKIIDDSTSSPALIITSGEIVKLECDIFQMLEDILKQKQKLISEIIDNDSTNKNNGLLNNFIEKEELRKNLNEENQEKLKQFKSELKSLNPIKVSPYSSLSRIVESYFLKDECKDDEFVIPKPVTNDEIIRCICGILREEGDMVQCDKCQIWQHLDCVQQFSVENIKINQYICEVCNPRFVPKDIPMPKKNIPKFEFAYPITYYLSLESPVESGMRIKVGDCVYIYRKSSNQPSSEENSSKQISIKNNSDDDIDGKNFLNTIKMAADNAMKNRQLVPFERHECIIIRVQYLAIIESTQNRILFGHHYLWPSETFHEPTRKFYKNELLRSPLCEWAALEEVRKLCMVLDPSTYQKGMPVGFDPEDVFICEMRVDSKAKQFNRIPKSQHCPVNLKSYAFRLYKEKLKLKRTYLPHRIPDNIKIEENDNLEQSSSTTNGLTTEDESIKKTKMIRLLQLTNKLYEKAYYNELLKEQK